MDDGGSWNSKTNPNKISAERITATSPFDQRFGDGHASRRICGKRKSYGRKGTATVAMKLQDGGCVSCVINHHLSSGLLEKTASERVIGQRFGRP